MSCCELFPKPQPFPYFFILSSNFSVFVSTGMKKRHCAKEHSIKKTALLKEVTEKANLLSYPRPSSDQKQRKYLFIACFYLIWWGKKLDSSTENRLELKQKCYRP